MAGRNGDPVEGFFAKVAEALAEVTHGAMTDIRQKLVEEAWFGRPVTQGEPETDMSVKLGWTQPRADTPQQAWDDLRTRIDQERGHQPERDTAHDHDFEK
jgi:hypothetical protein